MNFQHYPISGLVRQAIEPRQNVLDDRIVKRKAARSNHVLAATLFRISKTADDPYNPRR